LNRIDEIIIFSSLTQEQIKQIVGLMMKEVINRLAAQGMELRLTDEALDLFSREGYDRVFGARPLRRVIQRKLENQLSKLLLNAEFTAGDVIIADVSEENKLELAFTKGEGRANLTTFTPEESSASKSTITSSNGKPSAPNLRMAA
jgi:ATP-dependent Clp protease ATP-binding subunit ClpC